MYIPPSPAGAIDVGRKKPTAIAYAEKPCGSEIFAAGATLGMTTGVGAELAVSLAVGAPELRVPPSDPPQAASARKSPAAKARGKAVKALPPAPPAPGSPSSYH